MRKPIPALVGSLVRSSYICGLELEQEQEQEQEQGTSLTPRVCCPAGGLTALTSPTVRADPPAEPPDLSRHPGARHLASQDACGISLVHERTEELAGVAGLGQEPWLAILGNNTAQFSNTNNNCLGLLIGPQVPVLISPSHPSQ